MQYAAVQQTTGAGVCGENFYCCRPPPRLTTVASDSAKQNHDDDEKPNALCSYPHVKVSIRDLSQTLTTAPIFRQSHYFRQNI